MGRHVVATLREMPAGSRKRIDVEGRAIALFNIKGEFFAILDRCPHQGGSLSQGKLIGLLQSSEPGRYSYTRQGEILRCPWHGWEFDVRTGRSYCDPARVRTRSYEVTVAPGAAVIEGPYVAETFPVTLDEEYVVVEV